MKKYIQILSVILIFATSISCEDETIYTPDERYVVQAYLYANEPVSDITIRNTVPLTVSDSVGEPINSAKVTLYKNDVAYNLVSSSDSGTYSYPGDDLLVETDDVFSLEAEVDGKVAYAETIVPESPDDVIISDALLELPEISVDGGIDFMKIRQFKQAMSYIQLEVYWNNPNDELHFVVIENADDNQESILPDALGNFGRAGAKGAFRKISKPTTDDYYKIDFSELSYWGKYVVKVYRVNQEYADLYENLEQDSRDLNEPPTNIKNALGIFSAFHSKNVYFKVVKQ